MFFFLAAGQVFSISQARVVPIPGFEGFISLATTGIDCCQQVNYVDTYDDDHRRTHVTDGWVAEIELDSTEVIVTGPSTSCGSGTPNIVRSVGINSALPGSVVSTTSWQSFESARLMINANFFDVRQSDNPYLNQCTLALGLTISNSVKVSPYSKVHGHPTQTMIFYTPGHVTGERYARISDFSAHSPDLSVISDAVSGFLLIEQGNYVAQPDSITPEKLRPRTAIGLNETGDKLYVFVVNPGKDGGEDGGTTLEGLADYMMGQFGVYDALTLDGSGSAQLVFPERDIASAPSDELSRGNSQRYYRPVPVFLGFK